MPVPFFDVSYLYLAKGDSGVALLIYTVLHGFELLSLLLCELANVVKKGKLVNAIENHVDHLQVLG